MTSATAASIAAPIATVAPVDVWADRTPTGLTSTDGPRRSLATPAVAPLLALAGHLGQPARRTDGATLARRSTAVLAVAAAVGIPAMLVRPTVVTAAVLVAATVLALALAVPAALWPERRRRARDWALAQTTEVLTATADAGTVHGWAADVDVRGGAVEHLVLTDVGGFVATSAWHDLGTSASATLDDLTAQAWWAASRTRTTASAHGVDVALRPLVVVWGPGSTDLPRGGVEHDDVLVIRGEELGPFLGWVAAEGGAWADRSAARALRMVATFETVLAA